MYGQKVEYAYDMSNAKLLEAFTKACMQAGISGSGLVIDPSASYHARYARYLRGVVLARLEGKKPSFRMGDVVETKETEDVHPHGFVGDKIPCGEPQKISRVFYEFGDSWSIELKGHEGYLYRADEFSKVPD